MDILVRAFLCARENLHSAMKKVTVVPQHLVTAAQRYLGAVESQGQGLTQVHRLDCYGGESWSMRDIDDMIWAHYPSQEEDFFTALYGTSPRTLVDTHMRHRHSDYCGGVNGGHCRCLYLLRSRFFVNQAASPYLIILNSNHLLFRLPALPLSYVLPINFLGHLQNLLQLLTLRYNAYK